MQQIYNPYGQYKNQQKQSIEGASRVQLIGMLLEGAIRYNKKAILAVESNNKIIALEASNNANEIVMHLYNCLDFDKGGEVAVNLGRLYHFLVENFSTFVRGRSKLDKTILEKNNSILETILEGWKKVEDSQGAS